MNKRWPHTTGWLAGCAWVLACSASPAEGLSDRWHFIRSDAAPDADFQAWTVVRIPHTWNVPDALDGGGTDMQSRDGYYRGPGWYAQSFEVPAALRGRRVFVRFEAVSSHARVFLNGSELGEHRGAFTAFCFELTGRLKYGARNEIRVRADNAFREDIAPLSGDFPMFGGMYRPVRMFDRDQACITPLYFGSEGVFLHPHSVTGESAEVSARVRVSRGAETAALALAGRIRDAEGRVVAEQSTALAADSGEPEARLEFPVARPRLWNGRKDPYLYTVEMELLAGGRVVDRSVQPLGLRRIEVDPERGFMLNGAPCRLRGVNRHQDRAETGWMLTPADIEEDTRIMLDMGVNAVRLAHYPHAAEAYAQSDRAGLLVWAELPLVDCISGHPEFAETTRTQLREMILQLYNHPSIFCWSLFNEMYHRPGPDAQSLLEELHLLSRELDPGRLTVGATNSARTDLCNVTDLLAFNAYPGWYGGGPSGMGDILAKYHEIGGRRGIGVSEYGAGASILHHEYDHRSVPVSRWHPEEWQAYVHEENYRSIRAAGYCWGSFVWNMFDFASVWRNEGDRAGMNDKGLVTHDRKTKKDAYFFYRANWNPEPMVHITARRFTPRTNAVTRVKIYSNAPGVLIRHNGKDVATVTPDEIGVARLPELRLEPGRNTIEAIAVVNGTPVRDSCAWELRAP